MVACLGLDRFAPPLRYNGGEIDPIGKTLFYVNNLAG